MVHGVKWAVLWVLVSGVCGYLVLKPTHALIVVTALSAGVLLLRLDPWQRIYAVTLTMLFCSTSNQEDLADLVYYPRFVALVLLGYWTWKMTPGAVRVKDLPRESRLLITGFWSAVVVAAASIAWSADPSLTAQQVIALAALAWIVHGLLTRRWADKQKIAGDLTIPALLFPMLFAIGFIAVRVGIVEAIPMEYPGSGRFRGLYENPNALGLTTTLVLPLLWGLWLHSQRRIFLIAAIPTVASLIMCESRTAVVAVFIAGMFAILRGRVNRTGAVLLAVVGGGLAIAAYLDGALARVLSLTDLVERFTTNGGNGALTGRDIAWADALELWSQQPLEGYGYAAGPSLFDSLRLQGLLVFNADVVHNSYLQWLLELGIAGLIPLVLLLAGCVRAIGKARLGRLGTGLAPAVLAGILMQITESAMFGTGSVYPFLFWPIVAAALLQPSTSAKPDSPVNTDVSGS